MKGICAISAALALSTSPALAADQTIPLATMTCRQFVDSPKDTIGVILTWMMGYLQDSDEPAELNFSKMEELGKKLGAYCGLNPTHGVMRALDKVSDADDDSDVLRSVVGLWTTGTSRFGSWCGRTAPPRNAGLRRTERSISRRERSAPRTFWRGRRSGATIRSCERRKQSN
jgi:acid stress chaperone HdeB